MNGERGAEGGGLFTGKWFPQPEQYSTEAHITHNTVIPSQWLLVQAVSTIHHVQTTSSDFEAEFTS